MAIKEILRYPHSTLTRLAETVTVFDEALTQLATDLRDTAKAFRAEGLAANQIGVLQRAFVLLNQETQEYVVCINPVIAETQEERVDSNEGCLSFPGVLEHLKRFGAIRVEYQDELGAMTGRWFEGINAVAFQHELDHLNGILFTDHMGALQKRMALKRLNKVARHVSRQSSQFEAMVTKELRKIELAQSKNSATVVATGE